LRDYFIAWLSKVFLETSRQKTRDDPKADMLASLLARRGKVDCGPQLFVFRVKVLVKRRELIDKRDSDLKCNMTVAPPQRMPAI
jgi:hypothetical protein